MTVIALLVAPPDLLVAPPDLRPPRVLPARESSAPRASLGASSRSPARPRRPRGGLQSGGAWYVCPATAHRHCGSSLRRPSHQWRLVADVWPGCRLEARPGPAGPAAASNRAGLGVRVLALAPPPPTGTAAAPSGALHISGALSLTCGRGVVSKLVPAPLSLTVARCRRCVASPDCVCCTSLDAGSLISHVIPLRLFQDLNCDRWYFNVSACCCGVGPIELRAIFLGVGLKLRVGVADPSRETGLPVLVRACVGLKPASPLRARTCLGLKPPSPLRVRYGCFWCVFWSQWCRRFQWLLFRGAQW